MGRFFDDIPEHLVPWIEVQPVFFVASAPLADDGHVNLSPKGSDTFRVLDRSTVAYLDLTGSGAETAAHLRENGRLTIMFCAFADKPNIVRLFGRGRVVLPDDTDFDDLAARFPANPGTRGVVHLSVDKVGSSCGYSVPLMDLVAPRTTLDEWAGHKTDEELDVCRAPRTPRASTDRPPSAPQESVEDEATERAALRSAAMTSTLILLRHGQSTWNAENLFTGWWDSDLSEQGKGEATAAGELMAEAGLAPMSVHTSLQTRAIRTANLALDAMDRLWLPTFRHWRLNERHYGALTGQNKAEATAEFGQEQVHIWRRSYDTPPPVSEPGGEFDPNTDPRYVSVPPDVLPRSECLADVVDRMLPYWFDVIVGDLANRGTVLIAAHGNSLRALVKHLDGIADDDIAGLDIPTGVPLVYELDDDARPVDDKLALDRALGDPEAVKAAAEAVKRQATEGN